MKDESKVQRESRCENQPGATTETCEGETRREAVQGQVADGSRLAETEGPGSGAALPKDDESPAAVADATLQAGVSNTPLTSLQKTNVCIDYLKVRFDGVFRAERPSYKDWKDLIKAFKVDPDKFVADKGMSGYERSYRYGESMLVMAGGEFTKNASGQETFVIELKGSGCRQLEDLVRLEVGLKPKGQVEQAVHDAWRDLLLAIRDYEGKCTRIDIPTDDFSALVPFNELQVKIREKCFSSRLRAMDIDENPNAGEDEDTPVSIRTSRNKGWTATIGTRKECQLCIYNKAAERRSKGDIGAFNFKSWIRYEVRYYHGSAITALGLLTEAYEDPDPLAVTRFIVGCLASIIDVKDKKRSKANMNAADTWGPWANFVREAAEVNIVAAKRPQSTIESHARWLDEDVSKCLAKVCGAFPDDAISIVLYILKKGLAKIEMEDVFVINAYLAAKGRTPYEDLKDFNNTMSEALGTLPEPPEEIIKLIDTEVAKLGAAKYVEEEE